MEITTARKTTRAALQRRVRDTIQERALSPAKLAALLGLLPVGAEVLLAEPEWSLDTTVEVADALGLDIEFNVKPR